MAKITLDTLVAASREAEDLELTRAQETELLLALGSRLIDCHSQNMTIAARTMAERKTFGHLS